MVINNRGNLKQWRLRKFVAFLLGMVLIVNTVPAGIASMVFFYNPENSVDNFAMMKSEFDGFLSSQGDFSFQPFSERATFEGMLADKSKTGIYLLSSSHFTQLKAKMPLDAKLVGVSKGAFEQRKILVTKDIANISALQGATIAGSGSEEFLRNQLEHMLGTEYSVIMPKIKLLNVPKDIDALMAVGFGVATAAISSEGSLAKLGVINPKQHAQLKILANGEKSLMLIVATFKSEQGEIDPPLLKVIEAMGQQPKGVQELKMLGLDGWKRIDTLDAAVVKQLGMSK